MSKLKIQVPAPSCPPEKGPRNANSGTHDSPSYLDGHQGPRTRAALSDLRALDESDFPIPSPAAGFA